MLLLSLAFLVLCRSVASAEAEGASQSVVVSFLWGLAHKEPDCKWYPWAAGLSQVAKVGHVELEDFLLWERVEHEC